MTIYVKTDGVWTPVTRPYIKRNSVWTLGKEVDVKNGGVWQESYRYDVTPPPPPEISLQLIPASSPRYIKVGLRLPGAENPDLRRIRLLYGRTEMPTTPFGSSYLYRADANWPNEPWSEWWYNGGKSTSDHGSTTVYDYKEFPLNPTSSTNLPGGQHYYFAAWSEDFEGNWSIGTFSRIWMPREGASTDRVLLKESAFQADGAGSLDLNGETFTSGDLVVRDSPRSNGVWYFGNQFVNSVGASGTPTVKSARIRISRGNDSGQATANVRLYWHGHLQSEMPLGGNDMNDPTVVGTINKGETKWFPIPESWYPKFNTQIKGFGLRFGTLAGDYMVANSLAKDLRSGEVGLVWEEAL